MGTSDFGEETYYERRARKGYATIEALWTFKILKVPFVIWLFVIGTVVGVVADKLDKLG